MEILHLTYQIRTLGLSSCYVIQNVIKGVAYSPNILHHSRFGTQVTHVSFLQTDNRLWKIQSVLLENNISQKQAELNGLRQSLPFYIIIFCLKAFLLFTFLFYLFGILFLPRGLFCYAHAYR